jgi:hypothetical protein
LKNKAFLAAARIGARSPQAVRRPPPWCSPFTWPGERLSAFQVLGPFLKCTALLLQVPGHVVVSILHTAQPVALNLRPDVYMNMMLRQQPVPAALQFQPA